VVERVCSHIIILQNGKQLAYGTVEDLKTFQQMPSLEAAFAHLVQERDAPASAAALSRGSQPLT
jgi:ABC-type multidrug transport system ATPase subunit